MEKKNRPQKKGREAEKRSATALGGRLVPGSGSIKGAGGDIEVVGALPQQHDFLVEHKRTDNKSFRVTRGMLDKIAGEAFRANRKPAMEITFPDGEKYLVLRVCDTDWEVES